MAVRLKASPETCAWGYFDATQDPVLELQSGETVIIDTVSGGPEQIPSPSDGFHIPPELLDIHAKSYRQLPGHILTGPIAIAGARPGQGGQVPSRQKPRQLRLQGDPGLEQDAGARAGALRMD